MKSKNLKVVNLDCPMCAGKLETSLKNINGLSNVNVDFLLQKVSFDYDALSVLEEALALINSFEEVKVLSDISSIKIKYKKVINSDFEELEYELADFESVTNINIGKKDITFFLSDESDLEDVKRIVSKYVVIKNDLNVEFILLLSSLFVFVFTFVLNSIFESIIIEFVGYSIVVLLSGYPVFYNTIKSIKKLQFFDENFLMSIAVIGAIMISIFTDNNQMIEAALVMVLYQIGESLQTRAVNISRGNISNLIKNNSNKVTVIKNGVEVKVSPKSVSVGDIILIKPGDMVLLDSVVVSGKADFDTKSITGEANPKYLTTDDELLSGYISVNGLIKAKVTKVYAESTLSKVQKLVESSISNKAKPEKFITKFARIYTPIVCFVALVIAFGIPFIDKFLLSGSYNFSTWIIKALTVLVISCPCALVISVPLTYFNAIGTSAKNQVLIKGAQHLDTLSNVDVFLFDKTGTLTTGEFDIVEVNSNDKEELYEVLSALEANSNHKVASSIKKYKSHYTATNVKEISGCGMVGYINSKLALSGNKKLMDQYGITVEEYNGNNTVIYVSFDDKYLGYVELSDTLKDNAPKFLNDLKRLGIKKEVLLTGDNDSRATEFSKELDLDEVYSNLLPVEKLEIANKFKEDFKVAYVGDGINDTPVMSSVDCSFSMGKLGSDYCVEVSDFVVMEDNLNKISDTLKIAKKTKRIVLENIIGSIVIKVILMVLGFLGFVPLWLAVFGDVGVMLIAIINSLRVKKY